HGERIVDSTRPTAVAACRSPKIHRTPIPGIKPFAGTLRFFMGDRSPAANTDRGGVGMRSQINLGSVLGIKIGLHYSWFIIAFLIVLSLSARFHAHNPGWGNGLILALAVSTAILFFVSLLLHELSHSLVAKSFGIPVREITLF